MPDLPVSMTDEELAEAATNHKIRDQDSYNLAGDALTDIKKQIRLREAERDSELTPLRVALEKARQRHKAWMQPLLDAEAAVKAKMARYRDTAESNGVAVERAPGTDSTTTWRAEVTDLRTLIEAVASELTHSRYVVAAQTALNETARAEKGEMSIPGVRAVSKTIIKATSHKPESR